jgi:hypothetical protein
MNASCLATGRLFSPTTGHPLHTQIQLLSTYIDMEMAVRGNRLPSLRLEHPSSISSSFDGAVLHSLILDVIVVHHQGLRLRV